MASIPVHTIIKQGFVAHKINIILLAHHITHFQCRKVGTDYKQRCKHSIKLIRTCAFLNEQRKSNAPATRHTPHQSLKSNYFPECGFGFSRLQEGLRDKCLNNVFERLVRVVSGCDSVSHCLCFIDWLLLNSWPDLHRKHESIHVSQNIKYMFKNNI